MCFAMNFVIGSGERVSTLDQPGDWIEGLPEFRCMDKGRPVNGNDAGTEFTDPVDEAVFRRRM